MQDLFGTSVSVYMSKPALAVSPADPLSDVYQRLLEANVSSMAVVEDDELVGVVTRTDLLRAGQRLFSPASVAAADARRIVLEFAPTPVADIMTRKVHQVTPDTSVAVACARMCESHVHRVFVSEGNALLGVFSTLDAMAAIRDSGDPTPISEFMSAPIEVVDVEASVADATEQLNQVEVSGLIAVENDWPVGVFTQVEALAARGLDDTTLVEDAMDPALICMPVTTRMHRAAQQAIRMRVRRIVASENRHMRGILSGLDFARFVARSA